MSETQTEREREIIEGVVQGITQKKADTWTIQVLPEGANFAKNLWTKDVELVESLQTKFGQHGAFVGSLGAPYTVQGKEVRSWWISSEADGSEDLPHATVSPSAAPKGHAQQAAENLRAIATAIPTKSSSEMSKEEWARKDSAIHKMACIKTAAAALTHTVPSDPTPEDLTKFLTRVTTLTVAWHRAVLAERDDPTGEDIPF